MKWTPFLRQLLVCSGPWCLLFMQGLSSGFPTVLVPQLRKANFSIDDELASWIPATHVYSGIPWLLLLTFLIASIGRKKSHIIVCFSSLVGFIIFYFSNTVTHFLIGEFLHGALFSCFLTTTVAILTEYTSSKYRGVFMTIKAATYYWGVLTANAVGTFYHWKNIPLLGIITGIYGMITVTLWPESPLWLANKGKFEECATAHRWLKGNDDSSEKELQKLIKSYENRRFIKEKWELNVFKTIFKKDFMKPVFLSSLLISLHIFSGKSVCTIYAIDILKKISSSNSTAYTGMLILDCVTVVSMYVGCFISKILKRRVMLMSFSIIGIVFMIVISVYLYLVKLSIIDQNTYVSLFLLSGYSISVSLGPLILAIPIVSELLPLDSRVLTMLIIALLFKVMAGTFIKLAPFCFKTLAMHGTFAFYAVSSIVILIFIYFFLLETKDKTLQEINDCLKANNNNNVKDGEVTSLVKSVVSS